MHFRGGGAERRSAKRLRPLQPANGLPMVGGLRTGVDQPRPQVRKSGMGAKLGGQGGGRFDLGQNSDINVTPFVDVMLVLLIIFMVAIPAATVSIKLDLPPAIPPPPGTKVKEPVLINLSPGGGVVIGERAT